MNSLTHLTLTLTLICYWQWIIWWMRNVACDSSKQQTLSTSRPSATVTSPWHCPWGKSGMETVHEVLCFSNNNCIQLRFIRNNFSEPKHLLLPIHRKAVKSLTWNVWIVCVCVCVCVWLVVIFDAGLHGFSCCFTIFFSPKIPIFSGSFITSSEQFLQIERLPLGLQSSARFPQLPPKKKKTKKKTLQCPSCPDGRFNHRTESWPMGCKFKCYTCGSFWNFL